MKDQQRVMLTIVICLGIFVAWQYLTPKPPPKKKTPPKSVATAPAATPASPSAEGSPTGALPAPTAGAAGTPEASGTAGATPGAVAADGSGAGEAPAEGTPTAPPVPPEATETFENEFFSGEISNRGARLTRLQLKGYEEREKDDGGEPRPISLVLAERDGKPFQANVRWQLGTLGINAQPPLAFVEGKGTTHRLRGRTAEGLAVAVDVTPSADSHALEYRLAVTNESEAPQQVDAVIELAMYQKPGEKPGMFSGPGAVFSGICQVGGEVERWDLDDLEEGPFVPSATAAWAALDRQYFVVATVAEDSTTTRCSIEGKDRLITVNYALGQETIPPSGRWERQLSLFAGPKTDDALEPVSPGLLALIDYDIVGIPLGFIARPMIFLLKLFHGWVNSWGLAIMLLTLVVKILLFPFTYKSAVSMRKVQMLKPQLDKIKEQYPDDREKQQMAQWQLYKDSGANPLGGCLPMILQMPVWFALYRALWTSVDLYQESFLWLPDLTAKEPGFPIMALSLGVVMFFQQRLTPMSVDSQQAKMMKWVMPIMFTVFMFALPSGLVLYIFINSVLSIGQQLAINKTVGPPQAATGPGATVAKLEPAKKKEKKDKGETGGRGGRRRKAK